MKKILILSLLASSLFAACSKKTDNNEPANASMVTIDGTIYNTTVIGGQLWTTSNYNGSGGVNYDNVTGNLSSAGKLYTLAEAKAVVLPSGWRLPTQSDFNKMLQHLGAQLTNMVI